MSKASRKRKNAQKTSTPVLAKKKRPAEASSFEKEVCGLDNAAETTESEHSKNQTACMILAETSQDDLLNMTGQDGTRHIIHGQKAIGLSDIVPSQLTPEDSYHFEMNKLQITSKNTVHFAKDM